MSEIKLVCFDLDETLIKGRSWKTLNNGLGISDEDDRRWLYEYESGKISYERWNEILLERYLEQDNATRKGITEIFSHYELADGAREAVEYVRSKGYETALISGSIDIMVDLVAHDLGITYAKANNTFIFDDANRLTGIHTFGDDTIGKADHLESFCDKLGISMNECACIGNGENDIEMFRRTGHGITFRGSKIEHDAWKVIDSLKDIPTIFE
jgi:phosphoserine phosphatase